MEEAGKKGKGKAKEPKQAKPVPVLTKEILRSWQKAILEVRPCLGLVFWAAMLTIACADSLVALAPETAARVPLGRIGWQRREGGRRAMGDPVRDWCVRVSAGNTLPDLTLPFVVFNKLIVTTLKYTPVVLGQLVPFKEANGKLCVSLSRFMRDSFAKIHYPSSKLSSNTKQYATVQRLIKSYFVSLQALLNSVRSHSQQLLESY